MALRHPHFRNRFSLRSSHLWPSAVVSAAHRTHHNRHLLGSQIFSLTDASLPSHKSPAPPPFPTPPAHRKFSTSSSSPTPPGGAAKGGDGSSPPSTSSSTAAAKETAVKLGDATEEPKSSPASKMKSARAERGSKSSSSSSSSPKEELTPDQHVKQARAKLQEAFEQYSKAQRQRQRRSTQSVGDFQFVRMITQLDANMVPGAFLEGVSHAYKRFHELLFDEDLEELERILTPEFYEIVCGHIDEAKIAKTPKIKMSISNLQISIRSVSEPPREHPPSSFSQQVANWVLQKNNMSRGGGLGGVMTAAGDLAYGAGANRLVDVEVSHHTKYRFFDRESGDEITDESKLPFVMKDGKHSSVYVFSGQKFNLWQLKTDTPPVEDDDDDENDTDRDTDSDGDRAKERDENEEDGVRKRTTTHNGLFGMGNAVFEKIEPEWLIANVIDSTEAEVNEELSS